MIDKLGQSTMSNIVITCIFIGKALIDWCAATNHCAPRRTVKSFDIAVKKICLTHAVI